MNKKNYIPSISYKFLAIGFTSWLSIWLLPFIYYGEQWLMVWSPVNEVLPKFFRINFDLMAHGGDVLIGAISFFNSVLIGIITASVAQLVSWVKPIIHIRIKLFVVGFISWIVVSFLPFLFMQGDTWLFINVFAVEFAQQFHIWNQHHFVLCGLLVTAVNAMGYGSIYLILGRLVFRV